MSPKHKLGFIEPELHEMIEDLSSNQNDFEKGCLVFKIFDKCVLMSERIKALEAQNEKYKDLLVEAENIISARNVWCREGLCKNYCICCQEGKLFILKISDEIGGREDGK